MPRLGLANWITLSRMALSPLFAAAFMLAHTNHAAVGVAALWVLFLLIELSDVLDGAVARRSATVSDIGKILDPFADVVAKATFFSSLAFVGLVPLWFLLVFLYREFGIILLRMILYRDGYALGARPLGKLKTWLYALVVAASLLRFSTEAVGQWTGSAAGVFDTVLLVVLVVTAATAVVSFAEYAVLFARHRGPSSGGSTQ